MQRGVRMNKEKKCSKCQLIKKQLDYFKSYSPLDTDERIRICKKCLKDMVDINNVDTVKDMLRMVDKPFVAHLWESAKNKNDVIGEYFKLINAPAFRHSNWNDSILELEQQEIKETYDTNELKSYSSKWMGDYTDTEIQYLEGYLNGLHKDFKIVTENHKDYAKKIAKASLHMDTCFRDVLNGTSGADKKYKDAKDVFDTLSKSAQFSESQRGQNEVGLGCFGRVFEMVEAKIFIPEHIPLEKDDIDNILDDFSHISKSL